LPQFLQFTKFTTNLIAALLVRFLALECLLFGSLPIIIY